MRFTGARRTRTRHASRCIYTVAKTHSERVFDTRMAAFCMQSSRSSFSPTLPNMSAFSMPTDTYEAMLLALSINAAHRTVDHAGWTKLHQNTVLPFLFWSDVHLSIRLGFKRLLLKIGVVVTVGIGWQYFSVSDLSCCTGITAKDGVCPSEKNDNNQHATTHDR